MSRTLHTLVCVIALFFAASVDATEVTTSSLDAWHLLFDGLGGENWSHCSDKRETPCTCTEALNFPVRSPTTGPYAAVGCDTDGVTIKSFRLVNNNLVGTLTDAMIDALVVQRADIFADFTENTATLNIGTEDCITTATTFTGTNLGWDLCTPSPTLSPTTAAPTTSDPTLSPTTGTPSLSPSNSPSSSPTITPSLSPSPEPTTSSPSPSPTDTPTFAPSSVPTFTPTGGPSYSPTQSPTAPTNSPTQSPIGTEPTKSPSVTSDAPTNSPTQAPTTKTPTTSSPSDAPSTGSPSKAPIQNTKSPTGAPHTKRPSNAPTFSPTVAEGNRPGEPTDPPDKANASISAVSGIVVGIIIAAVGLQM